MNQSQPSSQAWPPPPPARPSSPAGAPESAPSKDARPRRGRWGSLRDTVSAGLGTVLGVLPHVLHHIALIGGTALVSGAGGNALFFVVGLVFSVPMLRRLYRRFHTWVAPAIALAVFAALFSVSAFVIGPAIAGRSEPASSVPSAPSQAPAVDHSQHHNP